MKRFILIVLLFFSLVVSIFSQTKLEKSSEQFSNGKYVWNLVYNNQIVGEFWPINGLNLVTRDLNPEVFNLEVDIAIIQNNLKGIATAPDGMTGGSLGAYQMQGKCLSHGLPCGDGIIYQYGIICVSSNGYFIQFTHANEIQNFDSLYSKYQEIHGTIFFLPSIFRNGNYLSSERVIDKVFIRRDVPDGEQIGVIIFNTALTCNKARKIILGLNRAGKSKTTHIYVLDGGPYWGQSCKKVNGQTKIIGTRSPNGITNYLVFY